MNIDMRCWYFGLALMSAGGYVMYLIASHSNYFIAYCLGN